MATKLTNKVSIHQAGVKAVFRLSDNELNNLRIASRHYASGDYEKATNGMCFNFAMYAFFDYDTTRAKARRFNATFNYHKGDFYWVIIN